MTAAREVEVSRSTGKNWSRGYKVYRHGQVIGFVPPLDRLAVREVNARYLSPDERIEIADLRRAGLGVRQIAERLGGAPSTISRELRHSATAGDYRPFEARRRATARRARYHPRRIDTHAELGRAEAYLPPGLSASLEASMPYSSARLLQAPCLRRNGRHRLRAGRSEGALRE